MEKRSGNAMIPLATGLGVSVVSALLLSRLLASVLHQTSTTGLVTYFGAAALLLASGAAASARPAWRAATGDPLQALRIE